VNESPWLFGWKEIGQRLRVNAVTARRWHKKYKMPVVRTPDGRPMQLPEIIDEWIIQYNKIKNARKKNQHDRIKSSNNTQTIP